MQTILHALIHEHPKAEKLVYPDGWHSLSQVGFAKGFAAEAHNPHFDQPLKNLATTLWMLYCGQRNLQQLPTKANINANNQTKSGWAKNPATPAQNLWTDYSARH